MSCSMTEVRVGTSERERETSLPTQLCQSSLTRTGVRQMVSQVDKHF